MTAKLYLITEAQRNSLLNLNYASASELLQSLPMVDSEPVAWRTQSCSLVNAALNLKTDALMYGWQPLYASPQVLAEISADDVTDAMVEEIFPTSATAFSRKSGTYKKITRDIANIYNAVIKHRSEAK